MGLAYGMKQMILPLPEMLETQSRRQRESFELWVPFNGNTYWRLEMQLEVDWLRNKVKYLDLGIRTITVQYLMFISLSKIYLILSCVFVRGVRVEELLGRRMEDLSNPWQLVSKFFQVFPSPVLIILFLFEFSCRFCTQITDIFLLLSKKPCVSFIKYINT